MTLGDFEWLGKYSTTQSIAQPLCDSWATCSDSHDQRDFLSFHFLWQCYSVSMTSRINIECMHGFAHRPKYRSRILDLSFMYMRRRSVLLPWWPVFLSFSLSLLLHLLGKFRENVVKLWQEVNSCSEWVSGRGLMSNSTHKRSFRCSGSAITALNFGPKVRSPLTLKCKGNVGLYEHLYSPSGL